MTTTNQISRESVETASSTTVSGWGKLGYAALVLAVIPLALTGIGTFILGKAPMTHWVLMAHASAAPLFAIGLAVTALSWAGLNRFGDSASACTCGCAKTLFWMILASGLVVILSGVVPMTPIFGTHGQHTLYLAHRYSAICFTGAVVLHAICSRK